MVCGFEKGPGGQGGWGAVREEVEGRKCNELTEKEECSVDRICGVS